jgi:hypothetical protein
MAARPPDGTRTRMRHAPKPGWKGMRGRAPLARCCSIISVRAAMGAGPSAPLIDTSGPETAVPTGAHWPETELIPRRPRRPTSGPLARSKGPAGRRTWPTLPSTTLGPRTRAGLPRAAPRPPTSGSASRSWRRSTSPVGPPKSSTQWTRSGARSSRPPWAEGIDAPPKVDVPLIRSGGPDSVEPGRAAPPAGPMSTLGPLQGSPARRDTGDTAPGVGRCGPGGCRPGFV